MGVWGDFCFICVLLLVVCEFGHVDVVQPVAILSVVFSVSCSLLMFVFPATFSSMGLVMTLYAGIVSFGFPMLLM